MSVTVTLSQGIFNTVLSYYDGYFNAVYTSLMDNYKIFFRSFMLLYTYLTAYKMAKGKDVDWWTIFEPFFYILIVYTIVLETSIYKDWVVDPIFNQVERLSAFFVDGNTSTQIFTKLDNTALAFIDATQKTWPSGWNPLDKIVAFFALLVLYFAFFSMFFAFLCIYTMSYFSMNIFFMVGGIFIIFATNPKTRGLFLAWLRNLFQHALTMIFASMTLGLSLNGIVGSITKVENLNINNVITFDFLSLVAWCVLTLALFLKCADFAAGLTSTMAGSTAGIAGGIAKAGGMTAAGTAGATAMGGGLLGSAAGAAAGWAWNKSGAAAGFSSATEALKNKLHIKS